jgi:hypothetical protein
MAQVMVAAGAGGLACWLSAALLLPRRSQRRLPPEPQVAPRDPSRDEDRVRPAVTASGERIWLEPDQLIWHEIVAWPEVTTDARRSAVLWPSRESATS